MNPACFYPVNLLIDPLCAELSTIPIGESTSSFLFYLAVFGLTYLFETPFYLIFGRLQKLSYPKILAQILVLNLATHPIVHFGITTLGARLGWSISTYIWVAEAFAFSIEILLLKFLYKYPLKQATIAATTANLCSWSVGVWLQVHQIL